MIIIDIKSGKRVVINMINADEAMKELTMALIYLSRFYEENRLYNQKDYYAWKGYDFDVLNELDNKNFIWQGKHPSKTKSVYITDEGINYAKAILAKYGIEDWE